MARLIESTDKGNIAPTAIKDLKKPRRAFESNKYILLPLMRRSLVGYTRLLYARNLLQILSQLGEYTCVKMFMQIGSCFSRREITLLFPLREKIDALARQPMQPTC